MTGLAGLAGATVLNTRPPHQADALTAAIEAAGGDAVSFPVIDIVARSADDIRATAEGLPAADIVMFVSPNAVRCGLAAVTPGARVAAVGDATAASLEAAGLRVDIRPATGFDSEALLREDALGDVKGLSVRILRGNDGRALLGDTLRERGARVDYLPVYRRRCFPHQPAVLDAIAARLGGGEIDYVVAMSVASLHALIGSLPDGGLATLRGPVLVTPAGRVIKTVADRLPRTRTLLAASPGAEDMVAAMIADRQTDHSNDR